MPYIRGHVQLCAPTKHVDPLEPSLAKMWEPTQNRWDHVKRLVEERGFSAVFLGAHKMPNAHNGRPGKLVALNPLTWASTNVADCPQNFVALHPKMWATTNDYGRP